MNNARTAGEKVSVTKFADRKIVSVTTGDLHSVLRINQDLREHNNRAGELVEGLTNMAVRNLQDAIGLLARYERRSRFWRIFMLIAVPPEALLNGGLAWLIKR
jgi:hypothetical protein